MSRPGLCKELPLFLLCIGLLLPHVSQANMYRWVDSNGKVHYSDTLPAHQAGKGHKEISKQGRTVKEVERSALTPEEKQRAEEARQRAQLAKEQEIERQRRDRALLSSFTNESEIDLVRDRALELEQLQITSLQARLDDASEKLNFANNTIKKHAAGAAPKAAVQSRAEARAELAQISEMLQKSQSNLNVIRAKYEADKLRFRELKGAPR